MTFSADLKRFVLRAQLANRTVFVNSASHVHESIVRGSSVTGSKGQLVDTGNLRDSWQLAFNGAREAEITTNVVYAPLVEDGITRKGTPFVQRSQVGAPHAVKLTRAGWPRIVAFEAAKVNR